MFRRTDSFNQDIGGWDVSSVTDMEAMFREASVFNQDISNWDINQVSNFLLFMGNFTGLSTTNYDALLVGWEANLQALYPGGAGYPYTISINFGGSEYSAAGSTARQSLIDTFSWTITDGGLSVESEYQDIIDYGNTQGYTLPSSSQQALQNQLVYDLKDAGVWSKLDIFYVFATDGDSDFASINWKDPNSYEIVEYNSPTFTTDVGFTGNGSSAYLDPSYNQGTDGVNWSNPNGSMGVWVYTAGSANATSYIGDVENDPNYSTMRRGNRKLINANSVSVALDSNNIFAHINVNSSQADLWYNGSNQSSLSPSGFVNGTDVTFLSEGGGSAFTSGTISIGFFGGDLSSEQSDFYTAVNSYMTSI
jgi:surface protein